MINVIFIHWNFILSSHRLLNCIFLSNSSIYSSKWTVLFLKVGAVLFRARMIYIYTLQVNDSSGALVNIVCPWKGKKKTEAWAGIWGVNYDALVRQQNVYEQTPYCVVIRMNMKRRESIPLSNSSRKYAIRPSKVVNASTFHVHHLHNFVRVLW